jgi:hypothetical protein
MNQTDITASAKQPKERWLKFGCFLTGYNYSILAECSEMSKKFVKKMTSALIVISIIWSFIGYLFASRYLEASPWGSLTAGLIMLIIIIQLERQIILSIKRNRLAFILRMLLGVIVAILGATIIDQIFFKNDLEIKKKDLISKRVELRTQQAKNTMYTTDSTLQERIKQIDSNIVQTTKAIEKEGYTVVGVETKSKVTVTDTFSRGSKTTTTNTATKILNPRVVEQADLRKLKDSLVKQRIQIQYDYSAKLDSVRAQALKEKPGFLDELNSMIELVTDSRAALVVYALWFLFFMFIELFIVTSKWSNETSDYERAILYQEELREKRLKELELIRTQYIGSKELVERSDVLINRSP